MARSASIPTLSQLGTFYPPPYDQPCRARDRKRLGDAAGLTQFGVNLLRLPPGAWSSQRHWHTGRTNSSMCWPARWSWLPMPAKKS